MISLDVKGILVHVGDTIRVHSTVIEGTKQRVQIFEGIVISLHGRGENRMMTVRRVGASGLGIERIWPVNSNLIVKIEVKKKAGHIRRSKLYYLRGLTGKQASSI